MIKTRIIVWQALSWPSMVVHRHTVDDGIYGHGLAVGKSDQDVPFSVEYHVALTMDWGIKEVSIKSLLDGRVIELVHKDHEWYDGAGQHLPGFDDVEMLDISISPFTNTLPIKKLCFDGEPQKIDMVYFDENKFSLRQVQQIYSQIDHQTYRYQDVELPDFVSNMTVDGDGLVIDFLKLFRRI